MKRTLVFTVVMVVFWILCIFYGLDDSRITTIGNMSVDQFMISIASVGFFFTASLGLALCGVVADIKEIMREGKK